MWHEDGCSDIADALPIEPALRDRLRLWQASYDAHDNLRPEDGVPLDMAAFSAEGQAIARDIKRALLDWTVWYFDEEKSSGSRPEHEHRYEITLRG